MSRVVVVKDAKHKGKEERNEKRKIQNEKTIEENSSS
jgi:hypothetical protein